jgi:hypothetical protein
VNALDVTEVVWNVVIFVRMAVPTKVLSILSVKISRGAEVCFVKKPNFIHPVNFECRLEGPHCRCLNHRRKECLPQLALLLPLGPR